jgi:hypothetical protein
VKSGEDEEQIGPAKTREPGPERGSADISTARLIGEIAAETRALIQKQWQLALTEVKADLRADLPALRGFGLGALAALVGANALVTSCILVLSRVLGAWLAGLAVGVPLLIVAGVAGSLAYRRFEAPLARTRRALRKDMALAGEHL